LQRCAADLQDAELAALAELESEEKKEMTKRHKAEHESLQKDMKKAKVPCDTAATLTYSSPRAWAGAMGWTGLALCRWPL
jgi:hypothetical protein